MPTSPCLEPRCPRPATGRGRCDEHRKLKERDRSRVRREDARQRNSFYARKRWRLRRRRHLFEHPLCERCGAVAEHVHHIVDLADGGAPYDGGNLESLCKRCHSRVTIERRRRLAGEGL